MTTEADLSQERVGRITASRIAGILGISPLHTREAIMRMMVRQHHGAEQEFKGNFITDHGHEWETEALSLYEEQVQTLAHGAQELAVHPVHGFLAATPDGLIGTSGLVEIKCPWRAKYRHIDERPDYEAQIRLQLECTGREWADFVVWVAGEGIHVSRVEHDPEWLPSILPTLLEFLEEYQEIIADPELSQPFLDPLKDQRADDEWAEAALTWLEAKYAKDLADERLAKAKQDLVNLAPDKPAVGAGVQVIHKKGRRTTAWARFAKERGLEPDDSYVTEGSSVIEVRRAG